MAVKTKGKPTVPTIGDWIQTDSGDHIRISQLWRVFSGQHDDGWSVMGHIAADRNMEDLILASFSTEEEAAAALKQFVETH
jgi:hypothetical protein